MLPKIHLNALLLSICDKLNIRLNKALKDINFHAAASPGQGFLAISDIDTIQPIVKDFGDMSELPLVSQFDKFPVSLNLILEGARQRDREGSRSQWYRSGGDERVEATELFRRAAGVCEQIYGG